MQLRKLSSGMKAVHGGSDVRGRLEHFEGWMARSNAEDPGSAVYDHAETAREYYDLCTEFMAFSWGESLHFAPISPGESLEESKVRHQRLMIDKLNLSPGMTVIDIGCGLGGPMRRVVREAGVRGVGINYSEVQLEKARALTSEAGLDHMVEYVACNFMDMSTIADDTFDRGYAIESTCHAPDKAAAFAEIYRVLKPGALLWGQEMCMTEKFDPADSRHRAMKQDLMHGIALNEIATMGEVDLALDNAGFQILEAMDRAEGDSGTVIPWYQPIEDRFSRLGIGTKGIHVGRKAFMAALRVAETLRAFPKGSTEVAGMLDDTANAYVAGGKAGIFTPLYCFLAFKPG